MMYGLRHKHVDELWGPRNCGVVIAVPLGLPSDGKKPNLGSLRV
jgi:hypothetical protein